MSTKIPAPQAPYSLITDAKENRAAFNALKRQLVAGNVERLVRRISYPQSGDQTWPIYWRPEDGYWSVFQVLDKQYWCGYGNEDPTGLPVNRPLQLTCQINPALEGKNGNCGGAFAHDASGALVYAHTGKVGGGSTGIGKTSFLAFRGDSDLVDLVAGKAALRAIVVGTIGTPTFPSDLAAYLRVVAAFRARPTADRNELDAAVEGLLAQGPLPQPKGQTKPRRVRRPGVGYAIERSPEVKAWVLQQAAGRCEAVTVPRRSPGGAAGLGRASDDAMDARHLGADHPAVRGERTDAGGVRGAARYSRRHAALVDLSSATGGAGRGSPAARACDRLARAFGRGGGG